MLSRAANSIYWIGRYVERAENMARLIDVNLHLMLDLSPGTPEPWKPLVAATGDLLRFLEHFEVTTRDSVIQFMAFDEGNPNSILSCVRAARENARAIRDVISSDMWEHLNATYLHVSGEGAAREAHEAPHDFFSEIKMAGRLFEGLTDDTLLHGEGYHFCQLGRLIERGDKTSRILDLKHHLPAVPPGSAMEDTEWSAVLQSAHALELYRKRHGRLSRPRIVEFLLLDPEFPRSVHFCLAGAEESLHAISGTPRGTFRNPAEQRLGQLRSELAYVRAEELLAEGLHQFLDGLQFKLNLADDDIASVFFTQTAAGAA